MIERRVIFVSGPPRCGKTQLVQAMAVEAMRQRPHHVRLMPSSVAPERKLVLVPPPGEGHLASSHRVEYSTQDCVEVVSEAVKGLPVLGSPDVVLLEGDADPRLRYAYPYDRRIFVMPTPRDIYDVFRTPGQAAVALRKVMEDTASFAAEIFGLFDEEQLDEQVGLFRSDGERAATWRLSADLPSELGDADTRGFLDSPIGMEIASRIQLQSAYQGLVESDVVVLNTAIGATGGVMDEVSRRLELLLSRIRVQAQNDGMLFCCDPCELRDPRRVRLFEKLTLMNHALAS